MLMFALEVEVFQKMLRDDATITELRAFKCQCLPVYFDKVDITGTRPPVLMDSELFAGMDGMKEAVDEAPGLDEGD